MEHVAGRIHEGNADPSQVDLLQNVALQMRGKCLCALGEFATMAVVTAIERFPEDFEARVVR